MAPTDEEGGDPACWLHLHDDATNENTASTAGGSSMVVDFNRVGLGSGGAVWSLPHGGDLDANLVRLDPGDRIDEHVNDALDVFFVVRSGSAQIEIDGASTGVHADHVVLIAKGAARSITAGPDGVAYLSVHRRRPPMSIGRPNS